MNAWTIGSGTLALILAAIPAYLQIQDRTAEATPTTYSITTPGDADEVDLCVPIIRGTGEGPHEGSVWLIVHGARNVGYYAVREVDPSSGKWSLSQIQVGSAGTTEGAHYELVLWQFDRRLTDTIKHIPKDHRVFVSPPDGASVVSQPTTVVRRADTRPCV
ncbi:hypothetical protein [Streptomyces chartreusis]|uniref:hypothetical protein n=1 Tax=Streptomyces chartreusis TaxID=1969 RepID=UPI00382CC54A